MSVAGVLVVGTSGFLGRAVASELRAAGHRVVGTYCSTPTDGAEARFDFWTDDVGALADEHDADWRRSRTWSTSGSTTSQSCERATCSGPTGTDWTDGWPTRASE